MPQLKSLCRLGNYTRVRTHQCLLYSRRPISRAERVHRLYKQREGWRKIYTNKWEKKTGLQSLVSNKDFIPTKDQRKDEIE